MSDDPTWHGLGRGLLVLAALWWAWTGYAWLTNTLEPEEGSVRAAMFGAMAAMLVVALAVPEAFDAHGVLFGVAFLVVRLLHIELYALAGKRDPDLLRAVLRFIPSATVAPVIIVAAGFSSAAGCRSISSATSPCASASSSPSAAGRRRGRVGSAPAGSSQES
jgi:low temperature requirement protein LtrA